MFMGSDIAVSGISIISPYGEGVNTLAESNLAANDSIAKINPDLFDKDISIIQNSPYELYRIQKIFAAVCDKALTEAKVQVDKNNATRISIFSGNTYGVEDFKVNFFKAYSQRTSSLINPSLFPYTTANSIASWLAIQLGIKGTNMTVSNGSTSASEAILLGANSIILGESDIAIIIAASLLCDDLDDEFYSCGFRQEIAGAIVLEKKQNILKSGRRVYASLEDISHGFVLKDETYRQQPNDCFKSIYCMVTHAGNSFAQKKYEYEGKGVFQENGINYVSLNNVAGNAFSTAGILGIAVASLIMENKFILQMSQDNKDLKNILFNNVDSYGSYVNTILS
jgi:hypothetical protein